MKNLIQIPRNFTSKFFWQHSGPSESYHDEEPLNKIESKKIEDPLGREKWKLTAEKNETIKNEKLELADLKKTIELNNILAKNNIDAKLDTPAGLTEELNHSPEATLDLNSEEFDYNSALQETNSLLAQLDNDIVERGFGPMNA